MCHSRDQTLAVHHIEYTSRDPIREPATNLVTVCEHCHEIIKHCKGEGQRRSFDMILAACDDARPALKQTALYYIGPLPPRMAEDESCALGRHHDIYLPLLNAIFNEAEGWGDTQMAGSVNALLMLCQHRIAEWNREGLS
jgi:hypothetical protein